MSKNKFFKDGFLAGKGFYLALAVCLIGAGSAAWVAVDRTLDTIDTAQPPAAPAPLSAKEKVQEEDPKNFFEEPPLQAVETPMKNQSKPASKPSKSSGTSSESVQQLSSSSKDTESGAKQVLSQTSQDAAFCLPIDSEISGTFSGDTLVKNITLNTWRTHNGVDLPAEKGTPVSCAFTGQVTKIYGDAMWGQVMEITGKDDLVAVYSGLSEKVSHKVGDVVKVGEIVGTVGEIPCESASENHLHFAVKQNGKYIDPMSIQ